MFLVWVMAISVEVRISMNGIFGPWGVMGEVCGSDGMVVVGLFFTFGNCFISELLGRMRLRKPCTINKPQC